MWALCFNALLGSLNSFYGLSLIKFQFSVLPYVVSWNFLNANYMRKLYRFIEWTLSTGELRVLYQQNDHKDPNAANNKKWKYFSFFFLKATINTKC